MKSRLPAAVGCTVLVGFAAAVWIAGPQIGFGDTRPLQSGLVRMVIVALLLLPAAFFAFRLTRGLAGGQRSLIAAAGKGHEGNGPEALSRRMAEALKRLERSSGRRSAITDLPWYVVIGPAGAGKSTAIAHGSELPLDAPIAVAATRDCELFLTGEAMFVDTAGSLAMQNGSAVDRTNWLALLSWLAECRDGRAVDGVVLVFSVADMLTLGQPQLGEQAAALRKRLLEMRETFQVALPLYVLFTKTDVIAGFWEFFGAFDTPRRTKVWGATFAPHDLNGAISTQAQTEFDALAARLSEEVTDRLHEEPDTAARVAIFDFPQQVAALKQHVIALLNLLLSGQGQRAANLRGFFFSCARHPGARHQPHGEGGYFLRDLLQKIIPADSRRYLRAAGGRRTAILRTGSLAAAALVGAALLGAWAVSFSKNRSLIDATTSVTETVGAEEQLRSAAVSDVDLENIVGVLAMLRDAPAGYATREAAAPIEETFGLSQRGKLVSAAQTAYRQAAERLLRSRLILQIEQTIQASIGDPGMLYEPLKIYLMLGGQAPRVDDELIVAWIKRDWEQNRYPGSANRAGREELETHLRAMLELDDGQEYSFLLDRPLIEAAQRSLSRMDVQEFAWVQIKSAIYSAQLQDFSLVANAGPHAAQVLETVDGRGLAALKVPGIYTYSGFNDFMLPQLAAVAARVVEDQWIMGAGGEQVGVEQQLKRLGPLLLDRYSKDFIAAWTDMLDDLKLKPMAEDSPEYASLAVASSATSPIRLLVEAISRETGVTRVVEGAAESDEAARKRAAMVEGLARIGLDISQGKSQARAGGAFAKAMSQAPGAGIEIPFLPFRRLVEGSSGRRPIDALVRNFYEIYQSLVLAANSPGQAERATANLQLQVLNLRANASRLPKQLARMISAVADDLEGDVARSSLAQLSNALAEAVTGPCREVVTDTYPFTRTSPRDISISDFSRLFAPNGEVDRFFAQHLAPLADIGGPDWQWREDSRLGRGLSMATLRSFQRAAAIRDAFFPQGEAYPAIALTFTPFSLHSDADMALLNINGHIVQSYQGGSAPASFNWPEDGNSNAVNLSLSPEIPGRDFEVEFTGPWALMRLLDTATVSRDGDKLQARFVIGGRDVAYTIEVGARQNPLLLESLREFTCPDGL
jgi:type VI secretion system protein ImpL